MRGSGMEVEAAMAKIGNMENARTSCHMLRVETEWLAEAAQKNCFARGSDSCRSSGTFAEEKGHC